MAGDRVPGRISSTAPPASGDTGPGRIKITTPGPVEGGKLQGQVGWGDLRAAESGQLPVFFLDFRTTGVSVFFDEKLGVNPNSYLCNAVDIEFRIPGHLDRAGTFREYRFRQTIQERHFQFVEGRWLKGFASTGANEDHPQSNYMRKEGARLLMYDSPGYIVDFGGPARLKSGIWSNPLPLGPGLKTDAKATQVVARNLFFTWVEGRSAAGTWQRVSNTLEWYSIQWVSRTSPRDTWNATSSSKIDHGSDSSNQLTHSP